MAKYRFFFKSGLLLILVLLLISVVFFARYSGGNARFVPLNHLSNSVSYNSNFQNLLENTQLKDVEFFVIGSSMALNNVSGKMMEDSFNCKAYNLSSWGFRSDKIIGFFENVSVPKCKRVVIAFNNIDFGINHGANYNFSLTEHYVNGNTFDRFIAFLKTFNFMEFDDAFRTRKDALKRNNIYLSLEFDRYGSVLLDTPRFEFDSYRYTSYTDTSGFTIFLKNMLSLKTQLEERNIRFYLVYMPYRRDLLTSEREKHNAFVAGQLRLSLPGNFIDMHSLEVPRNFYCDAAHMFRQGAEFLTKNLIDSLKR